MGREHLSRQFDADLDEIRLELLEMGGTVELMIGNAVQALVERDSSLARLVIATDLQINRMEMEIDKKCLHLLALRQPAARDLRFATLALKIVTDLERIGDQCANIAKRALELNLEPPLNPYADVPRMAQAVNSLLRNALDAFVHEDPQLAAAVCVKDRFVDELDDQVQREMLTFMIEDSGNIGRAMRINSVSKYLERVADHATNIAEMVIFMVNGKDIRHPALGASIR